MLLRTSSSMRVKYADQGGVVAVLDALLQLGQFYPGRAGYWSRSLRVFQYHPRALAQRQAVLGVLLDRRVKGRMTDHDQAGARHDLLDVCILAVPSLDLVIRGLADVHTGIEP